MTSISWLNKPLRLSVNSRLYNKNEFEDVPAFVQGWENTELIIPQLAEWVSGGSAYCAELKGLRTAKNFVSSGILSVDIDDGMTWDEALDHPLVKSSASLIYTSHSHTEEHHKFRIVFALENPIEDAAAMKSAMRSLSLRLSGDPSVIDPARLFYGNDGCKHEIFENGLSDDLVTELIEQSKNTTSSNNIQKYQDGGTSPSAITISKDTKLQTSDGEWHHLKDIPTSTSVHCIFHKDKSASALVLENKYGVKGLYCSTCASTYWSGSNHANVDFNEFEKALTAIKNKVSFKTLDDFLNPDLFKIADVHFLNAKHLPSPDLLPLRKGATFFKSPKASGKTEFLANLIEKSKGNVFLIGHRRSLIKQMCNRLNLHCYLDDDEKSEQGIEDQGQRFKRYGICLDSIMKIPTNLNYEYVLIDESEQVLSHFLSGTLDDKRNLALKHIKYIIAKAKNVYAMDADLDFPSFNYLSEWSRRGKDDFKSTIFINQFIEDKGSIEIHNKRNQITGDLHKSIAEDLKCYVTSNSKAYIEQQTAALKEKHPKKKFLSITSETIQNNAKGVFEFLDNPSIEAKKYDAVLASPSVSTGVDITFDDDEEFYDVVYGVFEPKVLTHFECDQQLGRVRHPKSVKVYISPRIFYFESDFDVVIRDVATLKIMDHLVQDFDLDTGLKTYNMEDEVLQVATVLVSNHRKSTNNLRKHFIEYKIKNGWNVVEVGENKSLIDEGIIQARTGKAITQQQRIDSILSASKIDEETYLDLRSRKEIGQPITEQEQFQFLRASTERFYGQPISEQLIKLDNGGKFRKTVLNYEQLTDEKASQAYRGTQDFHNNTSEDPYYLISNDYNQFNFIEKCLLVSGVYDYGNFKTDIEISSRDLGEFITFLKSNRAEYETVFNEMLFKDLQKSPIKSLNFILGKVGLKMGGEPQNPRKTRKENMAVYFYQFNSVLLKKMQEICATRSMRG